MKTQRKFSTGTLGRIAEHADKCRNYIRNQPKLERTLADEFIKEIQGSGKSFDPNAWQRFETMVQLKAGLDTRLNPR